MAFEVNSVLLSLTIMRWRFRTSMVQSSSRTTRQRGERDIDDQAQTFPGRVIDQGQDVEASAADQCIHREVERSCRFASCRIVIGTLAPSACLRPPRLRTLSRTITLAPEFKFSR